MPGTEPGGAYGSQLAGGGATVPLNAATGPGVAGGAYPPGGKVGAAPVAGAGPNGVIGGAAAPAVGSVLGE